MPTYQYACTDCGHEFEQVQSFSDPSLTVCPICGGRLRKVYGAVGVVFKGSGFYRNDSRKPEPKAGADAGGGGKAKDGAGKEGTPKKEAAASTNGGAKESSSAASSSSTSSSSSSSSSSSGSSSSGGSKSPPPAGSALS